MATSSSVVIAVAAVLFASTAYDSLPSMLAFYMQSQTERMPSCNIPVERAESLSLADFNAKYRDAHLPVIIRGALSPDMPASRKLTLEHMQDLNSYESCGMALPQDATVALMSKGLRQRDELPDNVLFTGFYDSCPELSRDYIIPEYFSSLLAQLPVEYRPAAPQDEEFHDHNYRWLIIGREGSGRGAS